MGIGIGIGVGIGVGPWKHTINWTTIVDGSVDTVLTQR